MHRLTGSGSLALVAAHWLAVAVSLLIYVLSVRMQQSRRPPTSAVAWVLGLIALPYLVLPAYLLFGTRKLARTRRLPGAPGVPHEHWAQRVLDSFGLAPAADVRTRLHADGSSALEALRDVIASAREQLDIAIFIFGDDAIGRELAERLA